MRSTGVAGGELAIMEVQLTPRLCTRATTDRPRIPVFTDPTAPDPRRTVAVEPQHQRIL